MVVKIYIVLASTEVSSNIFSANATASFALKAAERGSTLTRTFELHIVAILFLLLLWFSIILVWSFILTIHKTNSACQERPTGNDITFNYVETTERTENSR